MENLKTNSGLSWATIAKYAGNPLLERSDEGVPIYMHRANCVNYCDYACNGAKGQRIAMDVEAYEARLQRAAKDDAS